MTADITARDAAAARAKLAQALVTSSDLTTPAWRAAFEQVPRHVFVPYYFDMTGQPIAADDPATYERWFTAVHEDRSLVTHRTDGAATSSSTQPSLMAAILEALDVRDGMRVLEIGTGTGYNAALLAHRLVDDHVVTVDVTPDLTGPAPSGTASPSTNTPSTSGWTTPAAPAGHSAVPFHECVDTVPRPARQTPSVRSLGDQPILPRTPASTHHRGHPGRRRRLWLVCRPAGLSSLHGLRRGLRAHQRLGCRQGRRIPTGIREGPGRRGVRAVARPVPRLDCLNPSLRAQGAAGAQTGIQESRVEHRSPVLDVVKPPEERVEFGGR
ncbi:methyltransferase domain-containing protein [Streptomyces violascens]|uniref:hypothetical protein n=1 Tax=Streptomyces violascens TaxID=67381 RepID=UPI00369D08D4